MTPHWLEDQGVAEELPTEDRNELKELFEEVEYNDAKRDHSKEALTAEER